MTGGGSGNDSDLSERTPVENPLSRDVKHAWIQAGLTIAGIEPREQIETEGDFSDTLSVVHNDLITAIQNDPDARPLYEGSNSNVLELQGRHTNGVEYNLVAISRDDKVKSSVRIGSTLQFPGGLWANLSSNSEFKGDRLLIAHASSSFTIAGKYLGGSRYHSGSDGRNDRQDHMSVVLQCAKDALAAARNR